MDTSDLINYSRQIRSYVVDSEAAQPINAIAVRGPIRHVGKNLVAKQQNMTSNKNYVIIRSTYKKLAYKHQHQYSKDLHFIVKTTPVLYGSRRSKDFPGLMKQLSSISKQFKEVLYTDYISK